MGNGPEHTKSNTTIHSILCKNPIRVDQKNFLLLLLLLSYLHHRQRLNHEVRLSTRITGTGTTSNLIILSRPSSSNTLCSFVTMQKRRMNHHLHSTHNILLLIDKVERERETNCVCVYTVLHGLNFIAGVEKAVCLRERFPSRDLHPRNII